MAKRFPEGLQDLGFLTCVRVKAKLAQFSSAALGPTLTLQTQKLLNPVLSQGTRGPLFPTGRHHRSSHGDDLVPS